MASVNKVILVGNLGKDPETRYTPDGAAITNITVATTDTWKTRQVAKRKKPPSGIALRSSAVWPKSPGSTSKKAARFTSRAASARASGRIKKARTATPLKSSPTRCKCLVRARGWAGRVTMMKAVAVAMRAHRHRPALAPPRADRSPQRQKNRLAASTTWTTIFRFDEDKSRSKQRARRTSVLPFKPLHKSGFLLLCDII